MNVPTHTSRFQGQPGDRKRPSPAIWLTIARGGWLAVAGICVFLLVVAIPVRYAQLANPALEIRAGLLALGLPLELYVFSNLIIEICIVLGYFLTAALLFWRKSDEWFPLLVAFLLVTFGTNGTIILTLQEVDPAWSPLGGLIDIVSWGLLGFFLSLFPDGRFVPRWSLWYNIGMNVYGLLWDIPMLPAAFHPSNWPALLFILFQLGPFALFLGFQIYRYRYVSGPVQRQQTKWLLFGVAVFLCTIPFELMSITPSRTPATIFGLFVSPALQLLWLSIPLSLCIAILRYRLWDIDLLINRTLVYGLLTACVIGLYILVVGGLSIVFQGQGNLILSLGVTALIAVLFQPLRHRLQRTINRVMYGERDDPYRILSRLGQRLEETLSPEQVLPTIVQTTAQALKLPYVAVTLKQDDDALVTVAASGMATSDLVHLPLTYQGEHLGELLLAPRAPGEALSSADLRLLNDLAHHAGIAVYAVRLTTNLQQLARELQRSRTDLVTTREEERRRLRRDLHDGLGSVLTSLNLRAGAISVLLERDSVTAEALVEEQQSAIRSAITDIRRLVYDLRPPSLDELGLLGAIHEQAAHYGITPGEVLQQGRSSGLSVEVQAPEEVPTLPAALEVAIYRIVQEALSNVARYAQARTCLICLEIKEGTLRVEITDDGIGLPTARGRGVGLLSMRERAAELGGTCRIEAKPGGGTRVCALLPMLIAV